MASKLLRLRIIHLAILGSLLLLFFILNKVGLASLDASIASYFYYASLGIGAATALSAIAAPGYLLAGFKGEAGGQVSTEDKLHLYQRVKFIQWFLLEMGIVLNGIVYLMMNSQQTLMAALLLLIFLTYLGPNLNNFGKIFHLSEDELEKIRSRIGKEAQG